MSRPRRRQKSKLADWPNYDLCMHEGEGKENRTVVAQARIFPFLTSGHTFSPLSSDRFTVNMNASTVVMTSLFSNPVFSEISLTISAFVISNDCFYKIRGANIILFLQGSQLKHNLLSKCYPLGSQAFGQYCQWRKNSLHLQLSETVNK